MQGPIKYGYNPISNRKRLFENVDNYWKQKKSLKLLWIIENTKNHLKQLIIIENMRNHFHHSGNISTMLEMIFLVSNKYWSFQMISYEFLMISSVNAWVFILLISFFLLWKYKPIGLIIWEMEI